jgi:hypothetical protein
MGKHNQIGGFLVKKNDSDHSNVKKLYKTYAKWLKNAQEVESEKRSQNPVMYGHRNRNARFVDHKSVNLDKAILGPTEPSWSNDLYQNNKTTTSQIPQFTLNNDFIDDTEEKNIKRRDKLTKLSKKTTSIRVEDFITVMQFKNRTEFFEWFVDQSIESKIQLKGDYIEFVARFKEISCQNCGFISKNQELCPECKISRTICLICKGNLEFNDQIGTCLYCEQAFHKEHIAEWTKVKGNCFNCKKLLTEDDIIIKDDYKLKSKKEK